MPNEEPVTVIRFNNPSKFLEETLGVAPRSGICIFCKLPLKPGIDNDHSICNLCWDQTFRHKWTDYKGGCDFCDEAWDHTTHIRDEGHIHNFEPLDETKFHIDRYCPFCGYREEL